MEMVIGLGRPTGSLNFKLGLQDVHSQESTLSSLDKLAKNGNTPAARYAKGLRLFMNVTQILKDVLPGKSMDKKVQERVILELAEAIKIDSKIPEWTCMSTASRISNAVLERLPLHGVSSLDIAARICRLYFDLKAPFQMDFRLVDQSMEKYPEEAYFIFMKGTILGFHRRFQEGIRITEEALIKFPNNFELLYNKASFLKHCIQSNLEERVIAWKEFLKHADKSDRHVAEFHYEIAVENISQLTMMKPDLQDLEEFSRILTCVKNAYKDGVAAEKHVLPCNLRDKDYYGVQKRFVESVIKKMQKREASFVSKHKNPQDCQDTAKASSKLLSKQANRLSQLNEPNRVEIILEHRSMQMFRIGEDEAVVELNDCLKNMSFTEKESLDQTNLPKFKPITFSNMDIEMDHLYCGNMINLTSIEPTVFKGKCLFLIVEDDRGVAQRCVIYCEGQNKKDSMDESLFGIGCKFSIASPYFRMQDPKTKEHSRLVSHKGMIILHPEKRRTTMCRYCGAENAANRCSKCQQAYYCNIDCQAKDWKILKHKRICG